jgi:hypothetical protein
MINHRLEGHSPATENHHRCHQSEPWDDTMADCCRDSEWIVSLANSPCDISRVRHAIRSTLLISSVFHCLCLVSVLSMSCLCLVSVLSLFCGISVLCLVMTRPVVISIPMAPLEITHPVINADPLSSFPTSHCTLYMSSTPLHHRDLPLALPLALLPAPHTQRTQSGSWNGFRNRCGNVDDPHHSKIDLENHLEDDEQPDLAPLVWSLLCPVLCCDVSEHLCAFELLVHFDWANFLSSNGYSCCLTTTHGWSRSPSLSPLFPISLLISSLVHSALNEDQPHHKPLSSRTDPTQSNSAITTPVIGIIHPSALVSSMLSVITTFPFFLIHTQLQRHTVMAPSH